jgi:hypothetical protein
MPYDEFSRDVSGAGAIAAVVWASQEVTEVRRRPRRTFQRSAQRRQGRSRRLAVLIAAVLTAADLGLPEPAAPFLQKN